MTAIMGESHHSMPQNAHSTSYIQVQQQQQQPQQQQQQQQQPLPKCFCNWKNCRAYQKTFRECKHPIFNGVVKLKFQKMDTKCMALKHAVDAVLQVDMNKQQAWKAATTTTSTDAGTNADTSEGGTNVVSFCRYYVARHHFTEALLKQYMADRRAWDWNQPLTASQAKTLLWSLDDPNDQYISSDDEDEDEDEDDGDNEDDSDVDVDVDDTDNDTDTGIGGGNDNKKKKKHNKKEVRYVQSPNVPKTFVKELVQTTREEYRQAMLLKQQQQQQQSEDEEESDEYEGIQKDTATLDAFGGNTATTASSFSVGLPAAATGGGGVGATTGGNYYGKDNSVNTQSTLSTTVTDQLKHYEENNNLLLDQQQQQQQPVNHRNTNIPPQAAPVTASVTGGGIPGGDISLSQKEQENIKLRQELNQCQEQLTMLHSMFKQLKVDLDTAGTGAAAPAVGAGGPGVAMAATTIPPSHTAIPTSSAMATVNSGVVGVGAGVGANGPVTAVATTRKQKTKKGNRTKHSAGAANTGRKTRNKIESSSEEDEDDTEEESSEDEEEDGDWSNGRLRGGRHTSTASDDESSSFFHVNGTSGGSGHSSRKTVSSRRNSIHSRRSVRRDSVHSRRNSVHSRSRHSVRRDSIHSRRSMRGGGAMDDGASVVSRQSLASVSPSIKSLPREIELMDDDEEEEDAFRKDDYSFFDDSYRRPDDDARSVGSRSAASRASRRSMVSGARSRGRNSRRPAPVVSRGAPRPLVRGPGGVVPNVIDVSGDELEDETYNNVSTDTLFVSDRQIVDPYGEKGIYTGALSRSTGMPNGKGRLEYEKDGRWYEGDWIHGRWTGYGRLSNGDGDFYEGGLKNDHKHGTGVMRFADGRVFEGEYVRGQMIQGRMTYQDGSVYEGSWIDGMRHGRGRCIFVDGSEYDGEFREGNFHGQGKMSWNDGGWYIGEWCEGEMHGRGKEVRPDATLRHDGEWARGQPIRSTNETRRRRQAA